MSIPTLLDHIVIAGPDLAELIDWFAERTGVVAARGGAHPTGTANALVALSVGGERGPQYIELIGPDPDRADPELPPTFGISGLTAPAVQAYAVHPDDIEATVAGARERGYDPGDVSDLSRRTPDGTLLEWRLTFGTALPAATRNLEVPFLIDWGTTPSPGNTTEPSVELVEFVRIEPTDDDVARVRADLDALGLGVGVTRVELGEAPGYLLRLRAASGAEVALGVGAPVR